MSVYCDILMLKAGQRAVEIQDNYSTPVVCFFFFYLLGFVRIFYFKVPHVKLPHLIPQSQHLCISITAEVSKSTKTQQEKKQLSASSVSYRFSFRFSSARVFIS